MTRYPKGTIVKEIDLDVVEALARVGCLEKEIAWECGVNPNYFCEVKKQRPEIQDAIDRGHANLKKSLRAKQVDVALKDGNPQLLIFLGKAVLNQSEKVEMKHEITGEIEYEISFGDPVKPKDKDQVTETA